VADFSFQNLVSSMPQQPQQQSLWNGLNAAVPQAYPLMPQQTNLPQANAAMNLSPQEQQLYMRHITNLYGPGGVDNAPTPDNPQGSRSTLYQTVEPHDGKYYNIPTVWDGQIQTQRYQRPGDGQQFDIANQTTLNNVAKAGWNTFPSYGSGEEADARYGQMHDYLDKDTSEYFRNKR
jgi:hypothetical protein